MAVRHSIVYFVQAADGWPLKIGISTNLMKRLIDLRMSSGLNLKVLGVIDGGTREMEKLLHDRFADSRLVGEWFRPVPEIIEYIAANARPWEESTIRRKSRRISYVPAAETDDSFPHAESRVGVHRQATDKEKQRIRDDEIYLMADSGYELWRIAIITGLSEDEVAARLKMNAWAKALMRRGISLD